MTTVLYHSADYDGIFCREIAKRFLGEKDVQYIGWNFGDPPIALPINGAFVIMDLPIDKPFGLGIKGGKFMKGEEVFAPFEEIDWEKFTWIDHHKTSIDSHPQEVPGYRIDGVAACRLAWQWFSGNRGIDGRLPNKEEFTDRKVSEPLSVRMAGEYDIWDKRDRNVDPFQYGLRAVPLNADLWRDLLQCDGNGENTALFVVGQGMVAQGYARNVDADICNSLAWLMEWEGLKFLCVNHARFNSLLFAAKDIPETGHDALLGFRFDGKSWMVSMYHAAHRKDLDLSEIAKKYGGGGHRGACGFVVSKLPFL